METKLFRAIHLLAVISVAQYAVVRAYTWGYLGSTPEMLDFMMWLCIAYIGVFEPLAGVLDRRHERILNSLEYQVGHFAARIQFKTADMEDCFVAMITRQATKHGIHSSGGWAATIAEIVSRHISRWGQVDDMGGLHLHTQLERSGIQFDLDEIDRFDTTLFQIVERHASPLPLGVDPLGHQYLLARAYLAGALKGLAGLTKELGGDESITRNVRPEDFALAIDLYCMDPRVTDMTMLWTMEGDGEVPVGAYDLFWVLAHCLYIGIDPKSLRRYLGYHGSYSFLALEELLLLKAMNTRVLQELTDRPNSLDGVPYEEINALVCRWESCGYPESLAVFRQFPDDAAYYAHVQAQEHGREQLARQEVERRAQEAHELAARKAESAPKGRKRGQGNAPVSEPVDLDLQALCDALVVSTSFEHLDGTIVSVIMVMGLMATGDRLPAWQDRPSRTRGKIWGQIRSVVSGYDQPRRMVDDTVTALVRERVIDYTGGNYRLREPNDALRTRSPDSHALLISAKGLISRAKALAS
ncbi:MAG: hypothetical protein HQ488_04805 [Parcubacteria group bacterium]|nr:hypothetical protein [Parcubacteria group bacterium]